MRHLSRIERMAALLVWSACVLPAIGCDDAESSGGPTATDDDAWRKRHLPDGGTTADASGGDAGTAADASSGADAGSADAGSADAGNQDADGGQPAPQACTQTLSPGANVASVISSAAAGSTICLNGGDYGTVTISGVSKSSPVTLQSASGRTASIGVTLSSSNNLTFQNMTLTTIQWSDDTSTYIKLSNNTFTNQLYVYGNGGTQHNLIDSNTFDGISVDPNAREGRLSIYGGGDLVVSNNHFGGAGESDGIQIGGFGTVIGPGNVFENLTQGSYTRHIDSIQQYGEVDSQTITGNYFINDTVCIGAYDGSSNSTVTNNVFVATDTDGMRCVLDFGSASNLNFSHNTVNSPAMRVGAINMPTGSTGTITNNIFLNDSFSESGAGFSGTISYNLFTSSSIAQGTNTEIGTPTFTGGSTPTSMAGYSLTSGSIGYKSASDGTNRGINLN